MSTITPKQLKRLLNFLKQHLNRGNAARFFYHFKPSEDFSQIYVVFSDEFGVSIEARAPDRMSCRSHYDTVIDRAKSGLWPLLEESGRLTYDEEEDAWWGTWSCDVEKEWAVRRKGFTVEYKIWVLPYKSEKLGRGA